MVVVKDIKADTLVPIITSKIKTDSIVYTNSYRSYSTLNVNVSDFKDFRINYVKEFVQDHNPIYGIDKRRIDLSIKDLSLDSTTVHHLINLKS